MLDRRIKFLLNRIFFFDLKHHLTNGNGLEKGIIISVSSALTKLTTNTFPQNKTPKKKRSPLVGSLRRQRDELKSEWMRLEGDRIQLAVRHTDLLSQWNSISGSFVDATRERDETIERLLREAGFPTLSPGKLNNEKELRQLAFETAEKAVQTELW